MDAFWNFMSGIPWYAWIAIIVILIGALFGAKAVRRT